LVRGVSGAGRRFALTLVDELARAGVTDACLAPGSRSAPVALALAEHPGIRVHVHLDERSAAFFALGAAKRSGRAVVALCTSGTAAANFHPAVLEADLAMVPLLVLTADRPPELRGTGANQATDQLKLYGSAVRWFCEAGVPADEPGAGRYWRSLASRAWAEATGPPAGPVHLNVAFADPLVPAAVEGEARLAGEPVEGRAGGAPWTASPGGVRVAAPGDVAQLAEAVRANPRGLLVAGWGADLDPAAVDAFAAASGWPVLADPLSGARRGPAAISAYDGLVRAPRFAAAHQASLVVRVGGAPTSKALTAWLDESIPQVLVDLSGGWADPARAASLRLTADPSDLLAATAALLTADGPGPGDGPGARPTPGTGSGAQPTPRAGVTSDAGAAPSADPASPWLREWLEAERLAREAIDGLLDEWAEPFEGRVARDLVGWVPAGGTLVVGSSMPVRDVDAFARPREGLRFVANRGLSGIDGFVATALGVAAAADEPVVALCGDLTLLHDASSLLGAASRSRGAVLVVIDNDGGGIFSFLPQAQLPGELFEPLFGTPHGLDLTALAAAARVPARVVEKAADLVPALDAALAGGGTQLVVVRSDRAANLARHRALTEAVAVAAGG
jgi:2-succinyl-5-enolpyruvyl-6-hydroxy-3-cyclohexene-1-carboxylate synthase